MVSIISRQLYDRNRPVLDQEDHATIRYSHCDKSWRHTAGRNPTIFNFIDFCKAFDSVHRPALWKILQMYSFPEQIISILQNLYQDSKCAVRTNGDTSEWFNVQTGDRQGCILSPLLFAIVMDWVMRQSTISSDFKRLIWVDGMV